MKNEILISKNRSLVKKIHDSSEYKNGSYLILPRMVASAL